MSEVFIVVYLNQTAERNLLLWFEQTGGDAQMIKKNAALDWNVDEIYDAIQERKTVYAICAFEEDAYQVATEIGGWYFKIDKYNDKEALRTFVSEL